MKDLRELKSMRGSLERKLKLLRNDPAFATVYGGEFKLKRIRDLIRVLDDIVENYDLYTFAFTDKKPSTDEIVENVNKLPEVV